MNMAKLTIGMMVSIGTIIFSLLGLVATLAYIATGSQHGVLIAISIVVQSAIVIAHSAYGSRITPEVFGWLQEQSDQED